MPTLSKYLVEEMLSETTGGVVAGGSPADEDRKFIIGDEEAILRTKLREYRTWLEGDTDRLLSLYNKDNIIDFATNPWFWKNRFGFFWCASSTESDIKRTHSGQPANIIYTLTNLVGDFTISTAEEEQETLDNILEECNFKSTYKEEQVPMTLAEGWGAYKVGWNLDNSENPFISYYTAENVKFAFKNKKLMGIAFLDWYKGGENGNERYLLTEIRRLKTRIVDEKKIVRDLYIINKVWKVAGEDNITPITDTKEIPAFINCNEDLVVEDFDNLLATPTIIFKNSIDPLYPGRSIFENKIALFDMLDGILSQEDNAVQKSTVEELFNTDFLERDENNMPIMPKRYDRKYTTFAGGRTADGGQMSAEPVQVTQPNIDFSRYSHAAMDVLSHILSGIMSPATVGIGVATEATAQSQREKEKVTIATRNSITASEIPVIQKVCSDVLICKHYLDTGDMVNNKRDVSVKFSEFASDTFEAKSSIYTQMLTNGAIPPKIYVEKLWGEELSEEEKEEYIEFLSYTFDPKKQAELQAQAVPQGPVSPEGGEEEDPLAQMMLEGDAQE